MKKVPAKILGMDAFISSVPDALGNDKKETNLFVIEFIEPIDGKNNLIMDCRKNEDGRYDWKINPISHIKDRDDLLEVAGNFIDNFYSERKRNK